MNAPIATLRRAACFTGLSDDDLTRVARCCQVERYTAGATVFKEGDPGNRLCIVAEGEIRISRQIPIAGEEALAVLGAGACFGEVAVLEHSARSADAIAHTSCTLVTIARADLEQLCEEEPDVGYRILRAIALLLATRLRGANDQLRSVMVMAMF